MSMGPNAPHAEYPKPIGVMTATLLGFKQSNPYELVIVELQKPEVPGKALVLPGGIFNAGHGKHRSQRDVIGFELIEETGLHFADGTQPLHIAISQRLDVDPRRWCSFPTINGANDYIMAAPLAGELKPQDVQEVRKATWCDTRELDLGRVGRGHDLLVKLWKVICDCGGLTKELFDPQNRERIEAVSNDRHIVSVGDFTNMIYLEDRSAVSDERK